jgi:hypothetical protein
MAYELLRLRSFKATASLATKQFTFVKIDAAGGISTPFTYGHAIGVLQDKPGAGDPGAVCSIGDITKVLCGGAFNPGDFISTDSSGQAIKVSSGSNNLGVALTTGVTGFLADIVYQPNGTV